MSEKEIKQCPEFPFFGAKYPDACCIDGYLWDLDSADSDEDGATVLTSGGDTPCPFCNTEAFLDQEVGDDNNPTREQILIMIENTRVKYS